MPRKTLIITDVTAMSGDNVCIAGYDDSLICIRPVLSRGQIRKRHLFKDGDLIIFPGAKVAFNFSSPISQPPHVEDIIFEEASIESIGRVSDRGWKELLKQTAQKKFTDLFALIEDRYVPPRSSGPSIGTLEPAGIPALYCSYYKDTTRPRMRILDHDGTAKDNVPITDLAFRGLFNFVMGKYKGDCEKTVKLLNKKLSDSIVYLRLGLTRPFSDAPGKYAGWCCLQVNGIHTFPDFYERDYAKWIRLE